MIINYKLALTSAFELRVAAANLESIVALYIEQGYTPIGGVSLARSNAGDHYLMQAMVKEAVAGGGSRRG